MESQRNHLRDKSSSVLGKSFEQLTFVEQQQFVAEAVAEKDKFVTWAEKQKVLDSQKTSTLGASVSEVWKNTPSKKLLVAALSSIGLFNIGLPLAAEKFNVQTDVLHLWRTTFGTPIIEEMIFRSKKIPHFISWVGRQVGIPIPEDTTRLGSAVLFGTAHLPKQLYEHKGAKDILRTTIRHGASGLFYNKLAEEYGLGASISAHAIYNASRIGYEYLLNTSQNKNALRTLGFTLDGSFLVMGIMGIIEVVNDYRVNDMLRKIRSLDQTNPVLPEQIIKMTNKLLSYPSTDGYKFLAGVELAYVNAALTMPDMIKDIMTPDDYARSQVHKMVRSVWKDEKTLPHRLEKANTYITEQIAKRTQV